MNTIQTDREKDIQSLCQAVLNMSPSFYDNPNGGYEYTCPLCHNMAYGGNPMNSSVAMNDIKHSTDCAYLIAKDLSTNLL